MPCRMAQNSGFVRVKRILLNDLQLSDRATTLSYIGNQPYRTKETVMKAETLIKAMKEHGMDTSAIEKIVERQSARIWCDLNGRCECDKHIGMEASAKLSRKPSAKTITTSMTKWSIMSQTEIDELSKEYCNGGTICESCRYQG